MNAITPVQPTNLHIINGMRATSRKAIERAEINSALREAAITHGSHPDGCVPEDFANRFMASDLMVEIFDIVNELTKSKRVIFFPYLTNKFGAKVCNPNSTPLGERVVQALLKLYGRVHMAFHGHRAHPFIEKFCLEAERRHLLEEVYNLKLMLPESANKLVNRLNDFVDCIREVAKSIEVQRQIKKHLRSSQENERELSRYIDRIFLHYSRVMVLRVDLGYRKAFAAKYAESPYLLLDNATGHREKFLKRMRETVLKDCWIGYAWKLEYGPDKSFHYHFLIFLDGARVRQDVIIAKLIGEYWKDEATKGEGVYFNCNAKKDQYIHPGIGIIDYTNQTAINNLKTWVVAYLCKRDKYIQLFLEDGRRTFGKGEMLTPDTPRTGRPRGKAIQPQRS